jgi:RNA polymerase sigma-70 factor (ECF subfamily)
LLVAEDRGEPKLALYAGRGPLGPWLRASAWRAMLLARRRERPEVLLGEDDWLAWPAMADDPEIERLRRDFREGFKRAATEALEALDPKAKLLLRQHLLDGVPVNRLAPVYGVHVATIYRRLEEARAALVRDVRRRLAGSLRLETGDVERLLGLFESQLDVSVRRLLGPG